MSLLQEGRKEEQMSAPPGTLQTCRWASHLALQAAMHTGWLPSQLCCFLCLGLGASDIKEMLRDWRENKRHSDFPHFCIWFPCQWLSCEMLIPLHPVLHSCAGAGCTPARWRKYYSFYPFPEGKSPSVVHLITAGYCDWNFHYNNGCQELQCGFFWSLTLCLLILLAYLGWSGSHFPPSTLTSIILSTAAQV